MAGETKSADLTGAEEFLPQFKEIMDREGYTEDQVFNADETALYWRIMPDTTLALKDDATANKGYKQIKDRMTLLLATNWSGSCKLKPLVIGKSQNPRCFHHINMEKLPVIYRATKNAWMTGALFQEWFQKQFIPAVRKHLRSLGKPPRACLFVDNCKAHPEADVLQVGEDFKVFFLPKNTTSLIQPLDQGIISAFKRFYRTALVDGAVREGTNVTSYLKKLTIKDAVYMVKDAWGRVHPCLLEESVGQPLQTGRR